MNFKFKEGDKVKVRTNWGVPISATIIMQVREKRNHKYVKRYIIERTDGWRKTLDEQDLELREVAL